MPRERVRIEVATSRLEALVTISAAAPGTGDVEHDGADGLTTLRAALDAAGVIAGIRDEVVDRVAAGLADPRFVLGRTQIAVASPPVPGVPGTFALAFDMSLQPGTPRDNGSLDLQDRRALLPVDEGTVLATYRRPTPGQPGVGVDGGALAAPEAHDPAPSLGPGVRVDEEGRVLAARDGVVRWDGGVGLDVVANLRHDGDVDLRSGHLRMEGDIIVTGTVQPGFLVRATGSVEVLGDIDGGTVLAGGDVIVKGGILGTKTLVSSGGEVSGRRAQNATIRARGRVQLKLDAVDTQVAATEIEVNGTVRGGTTEAETSVGVKDAGGAAVGAHLAAGVLVELPGDTVPTLSRLAKAKRTHHKVGAAGRRSRGASALRTEGAVRATSAVRRSQLRARREAALVLAHVDVRGTAHPDVKIKVGERLRTLDHSVRRKRFRLDTRTTEMIVEDLT